jgi:hypothetical protein
VPRKFLERAFLDTYGFDIHWILGPAHPNLRSYRTAVRSFIPDFAEAEVVLHRHHFPPRPDNEAYHIFSERVSRTNYERRWKHTYKGPGFKAHLLAILVFVVPKVGAAADLAIKIPNPETQEWYFGSMNHTVDDLNHTLYQLRAGESDPIRLADVDLDTGKQERLGDYPLADKTYAELLEQITRMHQPTISTDLRRHIQDFYGDFPKTDDATTARLILIKNMKTKDKR